MEDRMDNINLNYEQFYAQRTMTKVYPTEFVVRTMLASYPELEFVKPKPGNKILDIGFLEIRFWILVLEMGVILLFYVILGLMLVVSKLRKA